MELRKQIKRLSRKIKVKSYGVNGLFLEYEGQTIRVTRLTEKQADRRFFKKTDFIIFYGEEEEW